MRFHRHPQFAAVIPIIVLGVACVLEARDTELPADTEPPADTESPTDSTDLPALAEQIYMAINMPQQLPLLTYGLSHYAAEGCPVVTQSDDVVLLTGDCSWSQGELQGSVSFTATSVTWNDWSMSFGDGTVVAVSGEQQLGETGSLTSDMVVVANVLAVPILPSGSGTYTYADYVVTDWMAYLGDPESEGDASDLLGTMEIEGLDSFNVNGTFTEAGQCDAYLDSLNLNVDGLKLMLGYTVTPDPCDACVDWDNNGSEAGSFCLGGP